MKISQTQINKTKKFGWTKKKLEKIVRRQKMSANLSLFAELIFFIDKAP